LRRPGAAGRIDAALCEEEMQLRRVLLGMQHRVEEQLCKRLTRARDPLTGLVLRDCRERGPRLRSVVVGVPAEIGPGVRPVRDNVGAVLIGTERRGRGEPLGIPAGEIEIDVEEGVIGDVPEG
jgi:hypothetical protein